MKQIPPDYTKEDIEADHLQDQYTLMFGILGRRILEELGISGEQALREAVRRYGADRGLKDRQKHLKAGCKINMYSAFNCGAGLPGNKRTHSIRFQSVPKAHTSQVLTCPMAEIWDEYGCFDIGRIYCEEFHFAYYNTYAFGKAKVNLATTLTERGTEYCSFHVLLNPAELSEEEKARCFEEYDTKPEEADLSQFQRISAQEGYRFLYLRLYYYIAVTLQEYLGEQGKETLIHGLHELAGLVRDYIREEEQTPDLCYLEKNYPVLMDTSREPNWMAYQEGSARELLQTEFCDRLMKELQS